MVKGKSYNETNKDLKQNTKENNTMKRIIWITLVIILAVSSNMVSMPARSAMADTTVGSGLSAAGNQFWYQYGSIDDDAQAYDRFGKAVAIGDFDGDGCDDLAVGVPEEDRDVVFFWSQRGRCVGVRQGTPPTRTVRPLGEGKFAGYSLNGGPFTVDFDDGLALQIGGHKSRASRVDPD